MTAATRSTLLALLAAAVLLGVRLGAGSLASTDDAVYAQVAREMAARGDWLEMRWMGGLIFEKPPLLFWCLRVSAALGGFSTLAIRLPSVLAGLVALLYTALLARAALPEAARRHGPALAVLLTLATVTFTMTTRRPITDPFLTAAVLATLWHGARACLAERPARHAAFTGLAAGLGVLAKSVAMGPAVLAVTLALALRRRPRALALAAVTGLLVAGPWYLVMGLRHGADFWQTALGYHVVARAGHALVGHADPAYYAVTAWEQEGALAPLLLLGALAAAWRLRRLEPPQRLALALVLATAALTALALQLSATRLFHYLMPLAPLSAVATIAALGPLAARPAVALATAALAALAFVVGPLSPHILRPDYAPESRALGEALGPAMPPDARLIIWEDYDPALIWYAARPARLWTEQPAIYALHRSIDMMRRADAVVLADADARRALIDAPEPIVAVAPLERASGLDALAREALPRRRVEVAEAANHRILRLGAHR
ncbi:MAG: glycosyltransferase family 39 protein [Deltaproteobacteria bacterium]|nr:glycosyltransferase family 39 protein [Deltaproteobacteria bacterium]MCB9788324.1 glycosyltransferase family 39 protein [Deltaproteobacteria bacterium]